MNHSAPSQPLRIAFVGLGRRGLANMRRHLVIEQATIAVLCDSSAAALGNAEDAIPESYPSPLLYHSWQEMLADRPAIDLVYVSTDWASHAPIAIASMEAGYNVAVEVPAVIDAASGERLIDTVRQTGRFFTMVENCCYDPFHLSTLALVEAGLLGQITHCEGAYIHDLRSELRSGTWHGVMADRSQANPYPTHGLGPICQILAATGSGDRLKSVVSVSPVGPAGPNSSLITTGEGRTVLLQYDVVTPRPYSRLQTVCGTRGYLSKYPVPMAMLDGMAEPLTGEALDDLFGRYRHPLLDRYEPDGKRLGVPNMMNYIMDRRLIDLICSGSQPDITVEDAVEWSSLSWLTRESQASGQVVEIPL